MSRKNVQLTDVATIKDLHMVFGRLTVDNWDEKMSPTPFPSISSPHAHPHASWSFHNPTITDWVKNPEVAINKLGGE